MTEIVIKRYREEGVWGTLGNRRLVYGRRKTGKSFFVRKFTEWDRYFVVGEGGNVYEGGEEVGYDVLKDRIKNGEYVVVDEFHRLPGEFLSFLQAANPERITLVTSTLHLAREIAGKGSPIMGMFGMMRFGLISPLDALLSLKEYWSGRELVERAVYYSDPFVLQYNPLQTLKNVLGVALWTVPLITSEVFTEEERELTRTYQRVLRALPGRYAKYGDIKARVGREGAYYLESLIKMGILEKIRVWRSRRYLYRHVSPVFDLYYYLDAKYSISETGKLPGEAILYLLPFHVEVFAERYFSELFGLRPVKILRPEVDIALVEFKRLEVVGEVKWKERVSRREIKEVEEKLDGLDVERKILVVPEESVLEGETDLDVWDVERMVREAERKIRGEK